MSNMSTINSTAACCEEMDDVATADVLKRLPKLHPTNTLMILLHNDVVREKYMRHFSPDFGDVYSRVPGSKNGRELTIQIEFIGLENASLVQHAMEEQVVSSTLSSWGYEHSFTTVEGSNSVVFYIKVAAMDACSRRVLRRKLSEFTLQTLARVPLYRSLFDIIN